MRYQPDRDGNWRSWLITVAQREAWRLDGKERGHIGFEVGGRDDLIREPADPRDVVAIRSELRSALDALAAVPERRREVKALWVTGFKYEEIQDQLGLTYTRVNRLMTEANHAIQKERLRAAPPREAVPVRAARLQELEGNPPRWLTNAIGRPPGKRVSAQITLPWRRAAFALDDYRREHGAAPQGRAARQSADRPARGAVVRPRRARDCARPRGAGAVTASLARTLRGRTTIEMTLRRQR